MSSTLLKVIALICMAIDHFGEFIPFAPVWFRWIGRISAPIFFFCMAWGFYYTKNRKVYLLRLYLCGILMAFINVVLSNYQSTSYQVILTNNIFTTLFISCLTIYIIDTLRDNTLKGRKYLLGYIVLQIVSTVVICMISYYDINIIKIHGDYRVLYNLYGALFGNFLLNEGGLPFVLLGVLLYYTKNNRKKLVVAYIGFCTIYTIIYFTNTVARILIKLEHILPEQIYNLVNIIVQIFDIEVIPIYNTRFFELTSYHWMIIFALPFMVSYNGKKGNGYKLAFYLFYPVHIYILYIIGNLIS